MSRLLFILSLFVGFLYGKESYGQTTRNPHVAQSNVENCKFIELKIKNGRTTVFMEYEKTKSNKYQAWIAISSSTYIKDRQTQITYPILELGDNLLLNTQYATTDKKGTKYNLKLIFPALPSGSEYIDIIENTSGGFQWNGIKINNPQRSSSSLMEANEPKHASGKTNSTFFENVDDLKKYFLNNINKLALIEGMWSCSQLVTGELFIDKREREYVDLYQIAIIKNENTFNVYRISDNKIELDYNERFYKTGSMTQYFYEFISKDGKNTSTKHYANFINDNTFKINIFYDGVFALRHTYVRLFPDENTIIDNKNNSQEISGTGFAISSDGFIVTNYHVIENASTITVKGIEGDFTNSYKANVVVSDKNNDLAIIQIDDNNFKSISKIPFSIKSSISDVGENVFVLGYPLRASMGDEIKLTNGIISSKTGFQGDITSYQISAPVQPGNSGGPLFDKFGNLIGVVNAKLIGAENAAYAIKASYLKNLFDLLPQKIMNFNSTSSLSNLSLSDQVKILNQFVYIIEIKGLIN